MLDKVKQLMEMKKQADRIKKELDALSVEYNEVRGIRIVLTGSQELRALEIDAGLLGAENKARLEADIMRSVNAAIKRSQQTAAQKMAHLMPSF